MYLLKKLIVNVVSDRLFGPFQEACFVSRILDENDKLR